MDREYRNDVIAEQLREHGRVEIDALAEQFAVSQMTIRRSLDELAGLGIARRVRGGAMAIGSGRFDDRQRRNARAKAKIAAKLIGMLPSTGTLAIDASSTVERLASTMSGARDLTVVTNGVACFGALQGKPGITALLTGGAADQHTGSLVGPVAARVASAFNYDAFVCSSLGVDQRGTSEASLDEAAIKAVFGDHATSIVLAVDHSKLGVHGPANVFGLDRLTHLVTDLDVDHPKLDPYRHAVDVC